MANEIETPTRNDEKKDDFFEVDLSEIINLPDNQIIERTKFIEEQTKDLVNEIRAVKSNISSNDKMTKENEDHIIKNKRLPLCIASVTEHVDIPKESSYLPFAIMQKEKDFAVKAAAKKNIEYQEGVIINSERQDIYLPEPGLVPRKYLMPGDLVAVHNDTYYIYEKMPDFFDSRVKKMECVEKPSDTFKDIGGCKKQIQQLMEAVVLPFTNGDLYKKLGIVPPKGVLLYGPPGTGKTLLARACANYANCTFFKVTGTELVQKYIGQGAKIVRECFELARKKAPSIIFIDEIDSIGTKRFNDDERSDREVQRTMLQLLNEMDGFASFGDIKVIAATNRVDTLDPALLRSGRFDRKIEMSEPNLPAREEILKIHASKMAIADDVDFHELARSTGEFNGAQLKAVCVEAGMNALRRNASKITHEDFVDATSTVVLKKKGDMSYFV